MRDLRTQLYNIQHKRVLYVQTELQERRDLIGMLINAHAHKCTHTYAFINTTYTQLYNIQLKSAVSSN